MRSPRDYVKREKKEEGEAQIRRRLAERKLKTFPYGTLNNQLCRMRTGTKSINGVKNRFHSGIKGRRKVKEDEIDLTV